MPVSLEIAGGGSISLDPPVNGQDLLQKCGAGLDRKIVAWHVNRYLRPLDWTITEDSLVDFVDTSSFEGMSVYRGTLTFVLSLACRGALGEGLSVRHSISDGYYCELQSGSATQEQTRLVREAAEYVVRKDLPIKREVFSIDSAERILLQQNEPDTANLLKFSGVDYVPLYQCDGVYGFFYGPLAPSTGYLSSWDLVPFREGMVLRFPTVAYPLELRLSLRRKNLQTCSASTGTGADTWCKDYGEPPQPGHRGQRQGTGPHQRGPSQPEAEPHVRKDRGGP